MNIFGYSADICPKYGCNNAPLVYLGKDKGWVCEDCLEKEQKDANEKKRNVHRSTVLHCLYSKDANNYVSGCGNRAGLNIRDWHYCPFCGRAIVRIFEKD